jgi:hypothetical protein
LRSSVAVLFLPATGAAGREANTRVLRTSATDRKPATQRPLEAVDGRPDIVKLSVPPGGMASIGITQ